MPAKPSSVRLAPAVVVVAAFIAVLQYTNGPAFQSPGSVAKRRNLAPRGTRAREQNDPGGTEPLLESASSTFPLVAVAGGIGLVLATMTQSASARPIEWHKNEQWKDPKGLFHQFRMDQQEQQKEPLFGQFFRDDAERVQLAQKRNGKLFSALNLDPEEADKRKAALMSLGLLAGLVTWNPGEAFGKRNAAE